MKNSLKALFFVLIAFWADFAQGQTQFLQKVLLASGDSVAINFSEVRYATANGSGAMIAYGKPSASYFTTSSLASIVSASCGNLVSLTEYNSGGGTTVVAVNPKWVKSSSAVVGEAKTRLFMDGTPDRRIVSGSFSYISGLLGVCVSGGGGGGGGGDALVADPLSQFAATTSAQLAGVITNETGTNLLVYNTNPVLVAPDLGTPTALVGTNITGTASALTAGTVTTNANLTGHITSVGNAASLGSFTIAQLSTAISDANISGTNTGDQTSIVGITGTKAEFNTALTDGDFLYTGDVTQYTDEQAQDAVGTMVDATLVYIDGTPLLTRGAISGDVTIAQASNSATVTRINGTDLSALATGLLKNTTSTGIPSIAVLGTDYGDIADGGNTKGATVVIGTNDNQSLSFETNNVVRATVTSGTSTGGAWTFTNVPSLSNAPSNVVTIQNNPAGAAIDGFGTAIEFQGKSSTTNNRSIARLSAIWSTANDATRTSALVYSDVSSGTGPTERFRFTPTAMTTASTYILGNSSSGITLGGGSGLVNVETSINNTSAILLRASSTNAAATASINVGGSDNYAQTSGTRNYMNFNYSFSPTSGTAIHNQLSFTGTLNQTGGANGIIRSVYINPTVTAAADYRAIESTRGRIVLGDTYVSGSGSLAGSLLDMTQTWNTSGSPSAIKLNVTNTASGASANLMDLQVGGASLFKVNKAGFVTSPTLYSATHGRATAQTAANASVVTYTVGAADASFEVSANVLVTASSNHDFRVEVDYTDESNVARTARLNLIPPGGTAGFSITNAAGAVPHIGIPAHFRCKAGTTITIKTVGTFTIVTYNVDGLIRQTAQ